MFTDDFFKNHDLPEGVAERTQALLEENEKPLSRLWPILT